MGSFLSKLVVLLILLLSATLFYLGGESFRDWRETTPPKISSKSLYVVVRDTLKLAVMEVHLSQIYEVKNEDLSVYSVRVPFTAQRSLVHVEADASFGFDLSKLVVEEGNLGAWNVNLPPVKIQNLDLKFSFMDEDDTFLNRITLEDRNRMMRSVRQKIRSELNQDRYRKRAEQRGRKAIQSLRSILGISFNLKNAV